MKTPEEARKAWVEALRSGEYDQGREWLHRDDKYCCLGVACHLAIEDGVAVEVAQSQYNDSILYDDEGAWLPESVRLWLGICTDTGTYTARNGRKTALSSRNDSGVKFPKIADIIESEPKGLFE